VKGTAHSIRITVCSALALLAIAAGAPRKIASAQEPAHKTVEVRIDNFSFAPQTLHVAAGTTVTWSNQDDIPHTVVSSGLFRSTALDTNDKFSFTFAKPGTYSYFCGIHPKMTGSVEVR
jgi:plastocyanin